MCEHSMGQSWSADVGVSIYSLSYEVRLIFVCASGVVQGAVQRTVSRPNQSRSVSYLARRPCQGVTAGN